MSTRTQVLLVALVALVLTTLSEWVGWMLGERSPWEVGLFSALSVVLVGIGALAWAGWGRRLLTEAGATDPSHKWWRLWFLPWGFWAVDFVTNTLSEAIDRDGFPDGPALLLSLPGLLIGLGAALVSLVLVLVFAFREIGHYRRKRQANQEASG